MKHFKSLITGLAAMLASFTVAAQTVNPPPNFFQQVSTWVTTPDSGNRGLETHSWRIELGPSTQSGVTVSDDFFVQHCQSNGFAELARFRNLGVGGTLLDAAGGVGWTMQHFDREITAYVLGGYRFDQSKPLGSVGLDGRIMIGNNTFTGIDAGLDFAKHMGVRARLTVLGFVW